jgi:hypothetical protein
LATLAVWCRSVRTMWSFHASPGSGVSSG